MTRLRAGRLASAALLLATAGLIVGGYAVFCRQTAGGWRLRPPRPTLAVVKGEVLLDGRLAVAGSPLPRGRLLTIPSHAGAVSMFHPDGTRVTVDGKAELEYLGMARAGPRYRLTHGSLFGKSPPGRGLSVEGVLGGAAGEGAVFVVTATDVQTGSAAETPRVMRVKVAGGSVRLSPAQPGRDGETVPAGLEAEMRESVSGIILGNVLGRQDWQAMTGSVPAFAEYTKDVNAVPTEVWIRREPGRHGPTPGSHRGRRAFYSPELGGGLLLDEAEGGRGAWLYSAAADAWKRLPEGAALPDPPAPAEPPVPLPAGAEGAAAACDPASGRWLMYGTADGRTGTWTLQPGARGWTRMEAPCNPPPRKGQVLYHDPSSEVFVLSGGGTQGRDYDDVWLFRPAGS